MEKDKLPKWLPIVAGVVFLAMPIITSGLTSVSLKWLDTGSAWIGFFGSYFGSVISSIATVYVLIITTQQTRAIQNKNSEADKRRERISREPLLVFKEESRQGFACEILELGSIKGENWDDLSFYYSIYNIGKFHAKDIEIAIVGRDLNILPNVDKQVNNFIGVNERWGVSPMISIGSMADIHAVEIRYKDMNNNSYITRYTVKLDVSKHLMYDSMDFIEPK